MSDDIAVALNELLQYRKSKPLDTAGFAELKHNKDLCPTVENQLETLLSCYYRYHRVAYDVQCLRDRGTDVVLRLGEDDDRQYVSFQIKSYDDLKHKDYLTKLKAQILEVRGEFPNNLEHCYVLICTDVLADKDKTRYIKKDLANLPWVTVIDPTYAWTFLRLSSLRIESVVQSVMRRDDLVYLAATQLVEEHSPLELAAILSMLWQSRTTGSTRFTVEDILRVGFFTNALSCIPDYSRDDYLYGETDRRDRKQDEDQRVAELIDWLDDGAVSLETYTGKLQFDPNAFQPLEALMLDAIVRYGYEGDELLSLMFEMLDVPRKYEIVTAFDGA